MHVANKYHTIIRAIYEKSCLHRMGCYNVRRALLRLTLFSDNTRVNVSILLKSGKSAISTEHAAEAADNQHTHTILRFLLFKAAVRGLVDESKE